MDYIKQVAEAVRDACQHVATDCAERIDASDQYGKDRLTGAYLAASSIVPIDLDPIILSVPKPEPYAYRCGDDLYHAHKHLSDFITEQGTPLYTHAPASQAEINRLKAEASKREAFIDQLVAQRHAELMIAATRAWALPAQNAAAEIRAVVEKIEQERGQ